MVDNQAEKAVVKYSIEGKIHDPDEEEKENKVTMSGKMVENQAVSKKCGREIKSWEVFLDDMIFLDKLAMIG